jgi:pimeloyl-ACP methyl ester carboxylesterase
MFKRIFFVLVIAALVVAALPVNVGAQEGEEWTCNEGPKDVLAAAQTAYDSKAYETAWWLAAHAEALCIGDNDRLWQAQKLRRSAWEKTEPEFRFTFDPGLVDLGPYQLFLSCQGEGSPTVIVENTLGRGYVDWIDIQPAISTFTRACAYDRLGIHSGLGPIPKDTIRTTQDQVDDLVALLQAAEIEPPYVLVGEYLAGYNILLLTGQHPDLVAGAVLVEAIHPDWLEPYAQIDPEFEMPEMGKPLDQEQFDLAASTAQASATGDFGARPLVVFTRSFQPPETEEAYALWMEYQDKYAALSTNSRHIISERAEMDLKYGEPERIIEATLWVLDEARASEE